MENAFEDKFSLSVNKLKNNDENIEIKSSNIYEHNDSEISNYVSSSVLKSKYFESIKLIAKDSQENSQKSSKISSVLDPYCRTNILDESDDFIFCESTNKFKNSKNESVTKSCKSEIISCEICKEDITHLDVHSRAVHVNNCIDRQIHTPPEPEVQTSTNENIFILECPLCFKNFSSPELRTNHIKKCGKSKGLSLQSIIKALELQERHTLERISLGLPAKSLKPVKSHKKTASKRAIVEPKNKAQSDIQLAKAMSLSLTNSKQSEEENTINLKFVTLKPPDSHQNPSKKSKKVVNTPVLVLRTEEERKKLLLDKVANIVAPQISSEDDSPVNTKSSSSQEKDENCCVPLLLWQLSAKAFEKHEYYVEALLDWIQPSDVEVGAKLCHLSQIAGHEIVTQLPCDYTFNNEESKEQSCLESTDDHASSPTLIGSLRSLVAASWMSDVDIYTACGSVIPAHRLLLAVRCLPLKQDSDFCSKIGRVSLKWENISFDAALQFLNFIYTGTIEIGENMKSDLLYLANKYEIFELQTLLLENQKMNIQPEIESNEIISEECGYKDLTSPLPSPSQNQDSDCEHSTLCETQENNNVDLEIVYNCINSSLKPSQVSMNEPLSILPTTSLQPEHRSSSEHLSDLHSDGYISSQSSKECSIHNCALPSHKSSTSPVIFDVSDSESENEMDVNSDNESIELPVNCSPKSVLQECNLGEKELDLCSIESSSSQDSVKFLESSFPINNSLSKTPVKEKNDFISKSPQFPTNCFREESPSATSDISRNSQESYAKSSVQKTDVCGSKEFLSDEYASLESPVTSHINYLFSSYERNIQTNSEMNLKELSIVGPYEKNVISNQIGDSKEAKRVYNNHLSSISTTLSHGISMDSGRDLEDDVIPVKSFSPNKSNVFSSPRIASSPEMRICDSETDLKSPASISSERYILCQEADDISNSQMKSNFNDVRLTGKSPKISLNFQERDFHVKTFEKEYTLYSSSTCNIRPNSDGNISPEGKGVMSSEADGPSKSGRYSFLGNEKYELTKKLPFTVLSSEEVGSSHQENSSGSSQRLCKSFDAPQCDESFEHEFLSSQKPKESYLYSSSNTKVTKCCKVTKSASSSSTQPQFQVTDSPVTPFPDYKNMVSPEIKQALRKIGVKALPRKKAVAILSHVYNETHPLINGDLNKESYLPEKTSKTKKLKRRKELSENTVKQAKRQQTNTQYIKDINGTQDSDDSSSENPEWQGCVPEISFSQFTQDSPTKSSKDDIDLIKQYILSNEELYNNILTYLPLNLITLHQELKDSGIKISIQKLMDYLDEQCITFTCPRKEEYRKKQTARAQRFRKNMIAKFSQQTV